MVLWDFKEWVVSKPSVTPALGQDSAMALDGGLGKFESGLPLETDTESDWSA